MKTNDIEELFEAAKRHEKDLQRQQRLSELVDQWGTSSGGTRGGDNVRRKSLWIPLSIAASILLMVSIGLRALLPQTPAESGTLVAENRGDTAVPKGEQLPTEEKSDEKEHRPAMTRPTRNNQLLAETPAEEPSGLDIQNDEADTMPIQITERDLLAQNDIPETRTATMETKVYERTSSRLVGRQDHKPSIRNRSNDTETPLITFNNTGTCSTYDFAKIIF